MPRFSVLTWLVWRWEVGLEVGGWFGSCAYLGLEVGGGSCLRKLCLWLCLIDLLCVCLVCFAGGGTIHIFLRGAAWCNIFEGEREEIIFKGSSKGMDMFKNIGRLVISVHLK